MVGLKTKRLLGLFPTLYLRERVKCNVDPLVLILMRSFAYHTLLITPDRSSWPRNFLVMLGKVIMRLFLVQLLREEVGHRSRAEIEFELHKNKVLFKFE
jgi:hypothetical protein